MESSATDRFRRGGTAVSRPPKWSPRSITPSTRTPTAAAVPRRCFDVVRDSMPRRVVGHAVDSGRWRTAGSRWTARRRRDIVRHAIHRTALTLATIVSLVVGVSDGYRSPSSTTSEDIAYTMRHTTTSRVVDADHGPSMEFHPGMDNIRHNDMQISDVSDNSKNEYSSGDRQSVSLSLLISILFEFLYI